jgi:thiamine pyrophosphokinase
MYKKKSNVVVLADGEFPAHAIPLQALASADTVVCCDGAAEKLYAWGRVPDAVVGDLDSLPEELKARFAGRLYGMASQETNDLTKAVDFCLEHGVRQLKILGAGGLREDHTIANVSLLADYAEKCRVEMITNYGVFVAISKTSVLESAAGQQVSVFSLTPAARISSDGLKYPLRRQRLDRWWTGSLNEAAGSRFTLSFDKGTFIVFRKHGES